MQDGSERSEEAGAWLRENLKDTPDPKVDITWESGPGPTPAQRARLLEILFGEDATA